jgi:TatA/E family protein of Tat protein translocase
MGIENPVHLLFIGAVALVVLGPKRLPEVARALGQGIREFREAMSQQAGPPVAHTQPPVAHTQPPAPAAQPTAVHAQPPAPHTQPVAPSEPPPVVQEPPTESVGPT